MSAISFSEMPGNARLWVFAASRPLVGDEPDVLLERVDRFLDQWLAHGHAVVGGRDLRYDQFLLIAADEEATGVSGCSIDALYRALRIVEQEVGAALLDASPVWYRAEEGEIRTATRGEFRRLVQSGAVDEDTVVFNNTVNQVGDVAEGRWEVPLRDSWHARAFRAAAER